MSTGLIIIVIVIILLLIIIIGVGIYLYTKLSKIQTVIGVDGTKPSNVVPNNRGTNISPNETTPTVPREPQKPPVIINKPATKLSEAQRVVGARDASWWKVLDGNGEELIQVGVEDTSKPADYDVECEVEVSAVGISDGPDTQTGKILGPILCKNLSGELTIIMNADGNDGVVDHYVPIKEFTCPSGYIQKAISYPNSTGISYICVPNEPNEQGSEPVDIITTEPTATDLPVGTCKVQTDCQPDEVCNDGKCTKIEDF